MGLHPFEFDPIECFGIENLTGWPKTTLKIHKGNSPDLLLALITPLGRFQSQGKLIATLKKQMAFMKIRSSYLCCGGQLGLAIVRNGCLEKSKKLVTRHSYPKCPFDSLTGPGIPKKINFSDAHWFICFDLLTPNFSRDFWQGLVKKQPEGIWFGKKGPCTQFLYGVRKKGGSFPALFPLALLKAYGSGGDFRRGNWKLISAIARKAGDFFSPKSFFNLKRSDSHFWSFGII